MQTSNHVFIPLYDLVLCDFRRNLTRIYNSVFGIQHSVGRDPWDIIGNNPIHFRAKRTIGGTWKACPFVGALLSQPSCM